MSDIFLVGSIFPCIPQGRHVVRVRKHLQRADFLGIYNPKWREKAAVNTLIDEFAISILNFPLKWLLIPVLSGYK